MPNERESSHGVMEGGGSYNRHARVPGKNSLGEPDGYDQIVHVQKEDGPCGV
jgi:hypothetical protein